MPKPIIVFHAGDLHPDRFDIAYTMMLTSPLYDAIRHQYDILMINGTKDERCYIIPAPLRTLASGGIVSGPSFGQTKTDPPEMIVPFPNTLAKLMKHLRYTGPSAKDPDEKQEVFGYKVRRSTMQDLESLITTGGHAAFKVSDDGELFITHAFPKGL